VQALFGQQQAKLAEKDFKITALTHQLASYRRVRFGKPSEALIGEQRLLFKETANTDPAAINEELEGHAPAKRQRSAPADRRCQLNCRASSTATSLHRASAADAAPK
jgi:hypothetical protein